MRSSVVHRWGAEGVRRFHSSIPFRGAWCCHSPRRDSDGQNGGPLRCITGSTSAPNRAKHFGGLRIKQRTDSAAHSIPAAKPTVMPPFSGTTLLAVFVGVALPCGRRWSSEFRRGGSAACRWQGVGRVPDTPGTGRTILRGFRVRRRCQGTYRVPAWIKRFQELIQPRIRGCR